jgi:transposase InsO family protein
MSGEDAKDRDVNGESRVEKFDGTHEGWPDFKSRIILHLERHDLDEMILGNEEPPLSTTKDKKASKRARAAIMLALDESCRKSVEENKTAYSVFKALTTLYEQKARGNLLRAERAWHNLAMLENEPINKYINRVKSAAKAISAHTITTVFGPSPNDNMVVNRVLAGLPERFDTFIQNLDQIESESTMADLTLTKVTNQLMNFEAKLKDTGNGGPNTVAFKAAADLTTQVAKLQQQVEKIAANLTIQAKQKAKGGCTVHPWAKHANETCYTQHPELRPTESQNKSANTLTFGYTDFSRSRSASVALLSARRRSISLNSASAAIPLADAEPPETICLIDSGCSWHMTHSEALLSDVIDGAQPPIELGDNSVIASTGIGTGALAVNDDHTCVIPNMLLVPRLGKSLLSMGQATGLGHKFVADGDFMTIFSPDGFIPPKGNVIATIAKVDNLYPMRLLPPTLSGSTTAAASATIPIPEFAGFATRGPAAVDEQIWHQRLAHVNPKDLKRLTRKGRSEGIMIRNEMTATDKSFCGPCMKGKMAKGTFPPSKNFTRRPGEVVGSDLEGPFPVTGIGGWRYYVSYIDYHTRFARVYLLKKKSDQLEALKLFEIEMFSKFAATVRRLETLQTDNAGEYLSHESKEYYRSKNILHRTIVAGDSQQNGRTERLNRTILEAADAVRYGANMPPNTWPMAVLFVAYVLMRRPHSALQGQITPFEAWSGRAPDLSHLRVFGCDAYFRVPNTDRVKLQPRARRAVMLGYSGTQKAYRLWDVERKKKWW